MFADDERRLVAVAGNIEVQTPLQLQRTFEVHGSEQKCPKNRVVSRGRYFRHSSHSARPSTVSLAGYVAIANEWNGEIR
jgi:hypothetical protein